MDLSVLIFFENYTGNFNGASTDRTWKEHPVRDLIKLLFCFPSPDSLDFLTWHLFGTLNVLKSTKSFITL